MSKYEKALNVERRNNVIISKLTTFSTDDNWAHSCPPRQTWRNVVLDQDMHMEIVETTDRMRNEIVRATIDRLQARTLEAMKAARDEAYCVLHSPEKPR